VIGAALAFQSRLVGESMRWPLRLICSAVMALQLGCGSARLDRALGEGQRQYEAGQWQRTIDEISHGLRDDLAETRNSEPGEAHARQVARAHLLMARAHRKLGHPAQALKSFDQGAAPPRLPDSSLQVEREELRRELVASLKGPPSSRVRILHRELLPGGFRLVMVEYAIDGETVFSWKPSEPPTPLGTQTVVTARALSPGTHYLYVHIAGWAGGNCRYHLATRELFDTSQGKTTDVTALTIDRGAKGTSIEENLDIDVQVTQR
jgi:hypothetical protein